MSEETGINSRWDNKKKYLYLDKFEKHQSEDQMWKKTAQAKFERNAKLIAMMTALTSLAFVISILAIIKVVI